MAFFKPDKVSYATIKAKESVQNEKAGRPQLRRHDTGNCLGKILQDHREKLYDLVTERIIEYVQESENDPSVQIMSFPVLSLVTSRTVDV